MLIQPAVQQSAQVAGFANTTSATGVEQEVVRADIPPVNESERNARPQNERFQQAPTQPTAPTESSNEESSIEESEASSDSSAAQSTQANDDSTAESSSPIALSEDDLALIEQLKVRDREVRLHEAAHAAVGGRYAGSPSYDFTRGPDGRNYATGGEVSISTSEVPGDPQATIEKARVIQAAALAPAQPSSQDRQVAASAAQMEVQARAELQAMKAEELEQQKADKEAEDAKSAQEEAQVEEAPEQEAAPVVPVVAENDDEEQEADSSETQQRPNAQQQLEQILLGSSGLLQQANQQGLVDPQNPYGKSGFLDVIV